jgi:hypothetical protein
MKIYVGSYLEYQVAGPPSCAPYSLASYWHCSIETANEGEVLANLYYGGRGLVEIIGRGDPTTALINCDSVPIGCTTPAQSGGSVQVNPQLGQYAVTPPSSAP